MKTLSGVSLIVGLILATTLVSFARALATQSPPLQSLAAPIEPQNFELTGHVGGDLARAVVARGNSAYVGMVDGTGSRLVIFDVSNPEQPVKTGQTDILSGTISDINIAGDYAYIANGVSGLRIVDISSSSNPLETGSYLTSGPAQDVAVAGSLAYVAAADSGLQIFNVSNPASPHLIGSWAGTARAVAVIGSYAYVADGLDLQIINVGNPTHPVKAGIFQTPFSAADVVAANGRIYVTDITEYCDESCWLASYLRILNVSIPTAPLQLGYLEVYGILEDAVPVGNLAYLGEVSGMSIWDISNPVIPTAVGSLWLGASVHCLATVGDHAYLADDWLGLRVADISNPGGPFEVGSDDTPTAPSEGGDIAIGGNIIYMLDTTGLQVLDASTSTDPVVVGALNLPAGGTGLDMAGSHAFVSSRSGLKIMDVSRPNDPIEAGSYSQPESWVRRAAIAGNYAYVAEDYRGLWVANISDPVNPTTASHYAGRGSVKNVTIVDQFAYVACEEGLAIVDISDPTGLAEVGFYATPGIVNDVKVEGDYAYLTVQSQGLFIIDISNPAHPVKVGVLATPGYGYEVAVAGNYAYIADYGGDFRIADVSNPISPTEVSVFELPGYAASVAVSGTYAYVAEPAQAYTYGPSGMRVIDVSDPVHPSEVSFYQTPAEAQDVAVAGHYAYMATDNYGAGKLLVLDITDAANPTEAGAYQTPWHALQVTLDGEYAYIAGSDDGLEIVNILNPATPTPVGVYSRLSSAYDISVANEYAYLAAGRQGLGIIDISDPLTPTLISLRSVRDPVSSVAIEQDYAYLATSDGNIHILDIANPANPVEVGLYDAPDYPRKIVIAGDYVYLADPYRGGLRIVDVSNPVNPHEAGYYVVPPIHDMHVSGKRLVTVGEGTLVFDITDPIHPIMVGASNVSGQGIDSQKNFLAVTELAGGGVSLLRYIGASATLTPEQGGTLVHVDTRGLSTTIQVPAGAVTQTTTLVYTVLPTIPAPIGLAFAGKHFDLLAYQNGLKQPDLIFLNPVTVTLNYLDTDLKIITDEEQLTLDWWNTAAWNDAASTCTPNSPYERDTSANTIRLLICQRGRFALFGPTHNALLSVILR